MQEVYFQVDVRRLKTSLLKITVILCLPPWTFFYNHRHYACLRQVKESIEKLKEKCLDDHYLKLKLTSMQTAREFWAVDKMYKLLL